MKVSMLFNTGRDLCFYIDFCNSAPTEARLEVYLRSAIATDVYKIRVIETLLDPARWFIFHTNNRYCNLQRSLPELLLIY